MGKGAKRTIVNVETKSDRVVVDYTFQKNATPTLLVDRFVRVASAFHTTHGQSYIMGTPFRRSSFMLHKTEAMDVEQTHVAVRVDWITQSHPEDPFDAIKDTIPII